MTISTLRIWHEPDIEQILSSSVQGRVFRIDESTIFFWFLIFLKLDSHRKGVLSVAWSSVDSDLLLSCGKDNRIICWNPNSNQEGGEVLCELVDSNQWSFNVAWCPRNPALIAATSFDNRVSVYSLMGGQQQVNITGQCFSEPKFEIVIQSWPL